MGDDTESNSDQCAEERNERVVEFGIAWALPCSTMKPEDWRIITGKYKNWRNNSLVGFTYIGEEYER